MHILRFTILPEGPRDVIPELTSDSRHILVNRAAADHGLTLSRVQARVHELLHAGANPVPPFQVWDGEGLLDSWNEYDTLPTVKKGAVTGARVQALLVWTSSKQDTR